MQVIGNGDLTTKLFSFSNTSGIIDTLSTGLGQRLQERAGSA